MAEGDGARCLTFAAAVVGGLFTLAWLNSASAERSTFVSYGFDQGLLNVGGVPLAQDAAGDLLVATERGLFAFDALRFVSLGPERGLRPGGEIVSVAITSTGHVAVQYPDEVYISTSASDASHPTTALTFKPVSVTAFPFYDEQPHRLVSRKTDFILLAGESAVRINVGRGHDAQAALLPYNSTERAVLRRGAGIFEIAGHLWETFVDGRVCRADPGYVRCYAARDGLAPQQAFDLVDGTKGRVFARSANSVSTYDPNSDRWTSVSLPDQGGRYGAFLPDLGLYRAPDGSLITQAVRGLDVLRPAGWSELTVEAGAPNGTIVDAMTDRTGQLWFHVLGRGLVHWVGYGQWNTIEKSDGLSDGFAWQTARTPNGDLWITTDSGLDKVAPHESSERVEEISATSSYALAATARGDIWAGYGAKGVQVISPSGVSTNLSMPAVQTIVQAADHVIWLGTTSGIYRVARDDQQPLNPVLVTASGASVPSIRPDGAGGVYYLASGKLHHLHQLGKDVVISSRSLVRALQPLTMAIAQDGAVWVGGTGGLYRLTISDDRLLGVETIPLDDIRTSTTYALMVDHRGWIWVGTDLGVTVFDGSRWVTVDASRGLLSNDVNEDGIREDPDGSVWITTARGLSHLLDPLSLFAEQRLGVIVTRASLGSYSLDERRLPYSREPLVVELGVPGQYAGRSIQFRYRLNGVDGSWAISSSGLLRYPFVPPGRHVLTIVADDLLSHTESAPLELTIDVRYPWWRRWWTECLWAAAAAAAFYGIMRWHSRSMYARQARKEAEEAMRRSNEWLEARVAERTAELSSAIGQLNEQVLEREQAEDALRQSQKMEAVGQLTGGIAHDFNNLLQGITGSLDVAQHCIVQGRIGELDRLLSSAMTSAARAASLTHRLLAFSRRQPLDPKPILANPLIASMEDLVRRTMGETIQLELVLSGGLWPTLGDPNQLESAVLNLVINARDAMPDGGRLTIETGNAHLDSAYAARTQGVSPSQYVCIAVTDTGSGMAPVVIERAFDPFFTTKPIGQGTGLGLSMIYGFARQSGGYCKIYSEVGRGTTVKLYLPRTHGEAAESAPLPGLTQVHEAESGEVVLVVEDEPVVRRLVVEVLRDLGYRILEAADGVTGLEVLRSRQRIDLLVTDVGLPGLNGRQMADAARERRPTLKVLFMTGYAENAAIASCFLEPGMAMITKPFAMHVLATRIRGMIEADLPT